MKKYFKTFLLVAVLLVGATRVNAEDMSNAFKTILTNGKYVVNSVEPTSMDEAMAILGESVGMNYEGFALNPDTCNSTYTKCEITYHSYQPDEETHMVDIQYVYDANIKRIVANYVSSIPTGKTKFAVKDMELVNYWANGSVNFSNYSGEFKSYVDNKNFSIDVRMGESAEFLTSFGGIGNFAYDGTTYYMYARMSFTANHIIYLPTNTGSTKEALRLAAQKRFDDYLGTGKAVITAGEKTVKAYYDDYYNGEIDKWQGLLDAELAKPESERNMMNKMNYEYNLGQAQDYKDYFDEEYTDEGSYAFLKNCEGNYYFIATIDNVEHMFVVYKDSTKMITPKYISSDVNTNITISSTEGVIPLDTLIKVSQITDGEEYDRIINILKVTNSEMFDLKLYSNSLDKNITKLDNGTFEVRIPISDKFKGKDLIVYYVDKDGKKIECAVTIDGKYAVFNTNHFSIYTLASTGKEVSNPKTGDSVTISIITGSIAVLSLLGTVLYKKKEIN